MKILITGAGGMLGSDWVDYLKKNNRNVIGLNKKDLDRRNDAKTISEKIKDKKYTIKKLSTENKELYGSVKPTEISKILKEEEKIDIIPSVIQPSKEIKTLGTFNVLINLHSEIQTEIKIKVIAQEENS